MLKLKKINPAPVDILIFLGAFVNLLVILAIVVNWYMRA